MLMMMMMNFFFDVLPTKYDNDDDDDAIFIERHLEFTSEQGEKKPLPAAASIIIWLYNSITLPQSMITTTYLLIIDSGYYFPYIDHHWLLFFFCSIYTCFFSIDYQRKFIFNFFHSNIGREREREIGSDSFISFFFFFWLASLPSSSSCNDWLMMAVEMCDWIVNWSIIFFFWF